MQFMACILYTNWTDLLLQAEELEFWLTNSEVVTDNKQNKSQSPILHETASDDVPFETATCNHTHGSGDAKPEDDTAIDVSCLQHQNWWQAPENCQLEVYNRALLIYLAGLH